MVLNCVAYGCHNVHDINKPIAFHTFPFKRPDILKLWIRAIRRENWSPSKTSRLCGEHFLPSDYQNIPGCRRKILKPDAIPSVFNFPKHLKKDIVFRKEHSRHTNPRDTVEAMDVDINPDANLPSTSTTIQKSLVDTATQTTESYSTFSCLKRKVKTLQQKIKRRNVKISNMKDVIREIRKSGHSNENLEEVLKNYFEGVPLELLLHKKVDRELKHPGQRRYSSLMKEFAHTLYFYSPKAYNLLKQYFVLPNGRTIRKWLRSLNCEPGLLNEVFEYLKQQVPQNRHLKKCALIIDGMAIRKQLVWDDSQGKFTGNVNYGGLIDVDFEMPASEALFFQMVSYTTNFKCPVAYFLINKADANIQTQLIQTVLRSLFEVGVTVKSLTGDGAQTNIATFRNLGCDLNPENLKTFFSHPCDVNIKVYCILDPCHMQKLARNTFADKNLNSAKGKISWNYIKELDKIQNNEGLRLANSLSSQHVNYKNRVMNVKLATQTISGGVADAIEFLDKKCSLSEFKDSSATVEFIQKINRLFDMLNSRNPYERGFKAPIRPNSLGYFEEVFDDTTKYLRSLNVDNINLLYHNRKTFALGFIMTMKSTMELAKELFISDDPLKYFLTYKFSQDHLELYFSCIRSRGGWNNNPNSQQLKWSLRQLLFRNSIKASVSANCCEFGEYCSPAFELRNSDSQKSDNQNTDINQTEDIECITKYFEQQNLSEFQENIIYYISGYIVRILSESTVCKYCVDILLNRNDADTDHNYTSSAQSFKKFTNFVSRGGLIHASHIVYLIVKFLEKQFRTLVSEGELLKTKLNIKKIMVTRAIKYFSLKIYLFVPVHPINNEFLAEELHEVQIIRKVSNIFLKCRMHHHSKLINNELHGRSATIRQKMSKLILFKNC